MCKRRLLLRIFREVFGSQGKVDETASSSNVADETGESPNGTLELQESGTLNDGKQHTPFCGPLANCKSTASNCTGNVSSAEKPQKCSSAKENKGKPPFVRLKLMNTDIKTTDCASNNNAREPLRVIPLVQQVQRPTRKIKPIVRLNYGIVECSIECFKKS